MSNTAVTKCFLWCWETLQGLIIDTKFKKIYVDISKLLATYFLIINWLRINLKIPFEIKILQLDHQKSNITSTKVTQNMQPYFIWFDLFSPIETEVERQNHGGIPDAEPLYKKVLAILWRFNILSDSIKIEHGKIRENFIYPWMQTNWIQNTWELLKKWGFPSSTFRKGKGVDRHLILISFILV